MTEKKDGLLTLLAAVFVLMPFVTHLLIGLSKAVTAYVLFPLSLLLTGGYLYANRGRSLRLEEKLVCALPLWFVVGCAVNYATGVTTIGYPFFASIVSVALFCFFFFRMISEKESERALRIFAWCWAAPVTLASLFGIYLAVTGTKLSRAGHDEPIGVTGEGRLFLFGNPNTFGVICCIALALLLYLLLRERKKGLIGTEAGMAAVVFIGLALSDCRSAKIAMLPALFLFGFFLVKRITKKAGKREIVLALTAGILLCVCMVLAWSGIKKGINAILDAEYSVSDGTEASEKVDHLDSRDYTVTEDLYDTANVRLVLWKYAMEHIADRPLSLILGYTPMAVKDEFIAPNPGIITVYDHIHCGYIGLLISYGLVGVAGTLLFLVLLLIASCRILFSGSDRISDAERFLPAILALILIVNCTEELLFTRDTIQETNVFFALIAGYVFMKAGKLKKNQTLSSGDK